MTPDPFVGAWALDPAQSRYEFGTPPQSGTYHIEPVGDAYHVTMDWIDAQGKANHQSYDAIPDGKEHPYENPALVDTVSMTRVDSRTLDSASFKGGKRIAYARRTLSADGHTMTIVQSGETPQGSPFANQAVYVRQT